MHMGLKYMSISMNCLFVSFKTVLCLFRAIGSSFSIIFSFNSIQIFILLGYIDMYVHMTLRFPKGSWFYIQVVYFSGILVGFHYFRLAMPPVLSAFYNRELSDAEKTVIGTKIRRGIRPPSGTLNCMLWNSAVSSKGYPVFYLSLKNPRARFTLKVARALIYLERNCAPLCAHLQVSHLCHQKRCLNRDHIRLEQPCLNILRKNCFENGKCLGHGRYENCLF